MTNNFDDETIITKEILEEEVYEKICNKLKSKKIREKGAEHLIDNLIHLYKAVN